MYDGVNGSLANHVCLMSICEVVQNCSEFTGRGQEFRVRVLTNWYLPACLTVVFLGAALGHAGFQDWLFARHTNLLSWIVRPLMVVPFCIMAWRQSAAGIAWSVFALFTSMAWFPAPEQPHPLVVDFLAMEQSVLAQGFSLANVVGGVSVLAYGVLLGVACWRQSWLGCFCVAGLGALAKSIWSVLSAPGAGHLVIYFASAGVLVLLVALWGVTRSRN